MLLRDFGLCLSFELDEVLFVQLMVSLLFQQELKTRQMNTAMLKPKHTLK